MIDFLKNFKLNPEDELWINILKVVANSIFLFYVAFILVVLFFLVRGWLGVGLQSMFRGREGVVVEEIPVKGAGQIQIDVGEGEKISWKAIQKKGSNPIKQNDKIVIVGFKNGSYVVQAAQE